MTNRIRETTIFELKRQNLIPKTEYFILSRKELYYASLLFFTKITTAF